MNYLVTTNLGNLYSVSGTNKLRLLEYTEKSIYTGENAPRFIKKYNDNYLIGTSEELLVFRTTYKPEIISRLKLPGLVDIKDVAIGDNFVAILSGLRDSVYVLNKELTQIVLCFNIRKDGGLEFFSERQVQCQEIPSTYFQIFYCPAMNNYHRFNRLKILDSGELSIISDEKHTYCHVNLKTFTHNMKEHDAIYFGKDLTEELKRVNMEEETITDYVIC